MLVSPRVKFLRRIPNKQSRVNWLAIRIQPCFMINGPNSQPISAPKFVEQKVQLRFRAINISKHLSPFFQTVLSSLRPLHFVSYLKIHLSYKNLELIFYKKSGSSHFFAVGFFVKVIIVFFVFGEWNSSTEDYLKFTHRIFISIEAVNETPYLKFILTKFFEQINQFQTTN